MELDLLISPFSAPPGAIVDCAEAAEELGFGGVWTYDHLTGAMLDRGRSHELFVLLGAIAERTSTINIGPLVANVINRHPVHLGVAVASLQDLSGGRVVLGLGAGSAPSSRFAREQQALGREQGNGVQRLAVLFEAIELLRSLWSGSMSFEGEFFTVDDLDFGLETSSPPDIILGASGPKMVGLAREHADGINIAHTGAMSALDALDTEGEHSLEGFDVSVHFPVDASQPIKPQLPPPHPLVNRWIPAVSAPFETATLEAIVSAAAER